MPGIKLILIILLLLIGFHLMLYGYLRRRITAAKLRAVAEQQSKDAKRSAGGDNRY